jgi:hypothetical protein
MKIEAIDIPGRGVEDAKGVLHGLETKLSDARARHAETQATLSSATDFVSSPPSRKKTRTPCPCESWSCSPPAKA